MHAPNQTALGLLHLRTSWRVRQARRSSTPMGMMTRGAKMWVPVPERGRTEQENVASLLDSLRLIKALNIHQPDLPIELTIEPVMKKSVNANVLKGRFVLPNPVPSPASPSSAQNLSPAKDLIAVILDDQSPDDVRLARDLGVDHVGGQDLLDRILAEEIKPTKLLVHTRSPKIQNMFTSAESKKTMFKRLAELGLMIPSEKRGTMSVDLSGLISNSKASIDWQVQKKKKPLQTPSDGPPAKTPPPSSPKTPKNSPHLIDSFIAIPVGSVQMHLVHLEQNIAHFLSMVSNLTQFGTSASSSSSAVSPKTPSSSSPDAPLSNLPKHKSTSPFKSGRPIKKPGIYKATVSVKGIPPITVI